MATQRPQITLAEREDGILKKIFHVTLTDDMNIAGPTNVYLELIAAKLISEEKPLMLSATMIESILVDRLSGQFLQVETPCLYFVGCYQRASEELEKIKSIKDNTIRSGLDSAVRQAKNLSVSYCRIYLMENVSEVSSLLPLITSDVSSPRGFLAEFFGDSSASALLEVIYEKLYDDVSRSVVGISALGNYQQPLAALVKLTQFPGGARALVNHPNWILKGDRVNGRDMEMKSILGPFFRVSALPDSIIFKSEPDVGALYSNSLGSSGDVLSSDKAIEFAMNNLHNGLSELLLSLLKNADTRERVLEYLAEVINKNSRKAQMQADPLTCSSTGMFVNLSAVMLRLCEPFLDVNLTKRDKFDPGYVLGNTRIDFKRLTALHASSPEVAELIGKRNTEKSKYSFICECFFLTARVLNLGLVKAFSEYKQIVQELSERKEALSELKPELEQAYSPQLAEKIAHLEEKVESYSQERHCYEAQLFKDTTILRRGLEFYSLMVVWLVDLVGGFKMPLPSSCPLLFACMPEHFVEDAMKLLKTVSRIPKPVVGFRFDEFMSFIIMMMSSSQYIKNPYLRTEMVEVLISWMPERSTPSSTADLFAGHQLWCDYLVSNLLKLYVEIESTGTHSQFYDKFFTRHNITKLLGYLWNLPVHQNRWMQIASEEKQGVYLHFLNYLINDSIYLLDDGFKKIQELKETEAEAEITREHHSQERMIRMDMKCAMDNTAMLEFTTERITASFLVPEMVDRVANMLNYFLLQLTGPGQQRSLAIKDREKKFEFRPKELLGKIFRIYIHLARSDSEGEGVFPAAISRDDRSYNDQLFSGAVHILWKINEDGMLIEEFVALGEKVKAVKNKAVDDEAALGEIPDEFLDLIQYTMMKDPVILPSGNSVDRSVIERHLLSDSTDPFTRARLTRDMLQPNLELKARIDEFVRSQQQNAMLL